MSLRRLRAREQRFWMPETCVIERLTVTPDPWGGSTEEWAEVATVRCRVAPAGITAQEQVIADKVQVATMVTLVVPHGTDVHPTDRMTVNGKTYEVVAPVEGTMQANLRVVCRGD